MPANAEVKASKFFLIAIGLFFVLGSEFLVLFIDVYVDGRTMSQFGVWSIHWYAAIIHWAITILVWGTAIAFTIRWTRRRGTISGLLTFDVNSKTALWIGVVVILLVVGTAFERGLSGLGVPEVVREYRGFIRKYGEFALPVTVAQYVYYFFESELVVLVTALFQRAGELWSKKSSVPWGGIGLLLTWGGAHFLSHPEGALYTTIYAMVIGSVYLLSSKNFLPTYCTVILAFFI